MESVFELSLDVLTIEESFATDASKLFWKLGDLKLNKKLRYI